MTTLSLRNWWTNRAKNLSLDGASRRLGGILLGLGLSAGDVDKMIGMPFMGRLEQLEPMQEIVGSIQPDESTKGNVSTSCGVSGRRNSRSLCTLG